MPRKNFIRSKTFPYHATARTNNRELFHLPLDQVWEILGKELFLQQTIYGVKVHAFVLMPNHFHLIASTPFENLDTFMRDWLSYSTRNLNWKSGRSGRIFGARYFWTLIDHSNYYSRALKYVLRNPVQARICKSVFDYPFSSFKTILAENQPPFQISPAIEEFQKNIPECPIQLAEWTNIGFQNRELEKIRSALKKRIFKFPKNKKYEPCMLQD